jgi:hypothetical protein
MVRNLADPELGWGNLITFLSILVKGHITALAKAATLFGYSTSKHFPRLRFFSQHKQDKLGYHFGLDGQIPEHLALFLSNR